MNESDFTHLPGSTPFPGGVDPAGVHQDQDKGSKSKVPALEGLRQLEDDYPKPHKKVFGPEKPLSLKTEDKIKSSVEEKLPILAKQEPKTSSTLAPFKLPIISDYVKSNPTDNPVINTNMISMAKALDKHAEKNLLIQIERDIQNAEKKSSKPLTANEKEVIINKVQKKFENSLTFFITVDLRKSRENPLERMAAPFAHLDKSSEKSFLEGSSEFSAHLVVLAFEQHRENPEQYVSHGFDHSINVANYTRDVLTMNPQIVNAMSKKYRISEGEARFFLENVALLHDAGYPCVGCRCKAVHGISGADLVLPMRPMFDKVIMSPGADKENLFNDFRNAILFHSADKIESTFRVKINTTMGVFLADPENIVTVLSHFYDPSKNPANTPRYALEIYAQNDEEKELIEQAMDASHKEFEKTYGGIVFLPRVEIHKGLFEGRFADLELNKDRMMGLEFSMTDLLENPLNMIRLVDNMDMRRTRLTPTQNELSFREVYVRLGDYRGVSDLAIRLENFERNMSSNKQNIPKEDFDAQNAFSLDMAKETRTVLVDYRSKLSDDDPLESEVKQIFLKHVFC